MSIRQFFEYYKTVFYNISIFFCLLVLIRISLRVAVHLLRFILRLIEERNLIRTDSNISIVRSITVYELDKNQNEDSQANATNINGSFTMKLRNNRYKISNVEPTNKSPKNMKLNVKYDELMPEIEEYFSSNNQNN